MHQGIALTAGAMLLAAILGAAGVYAYLADDGRSASRVFPSSTLTLESPADGRGTLHRAHGTLQGPFRVGDTATGNLHLRVGPLPSDRPMDLDLALDAVASGPEAAAPGSLERDLKVTYLAFGEENLLGVPCWRHAGAEAPSYPADLNGNGRIDLHDLRQQVCADLPAGSREIAVSLAVTDGTHARSGSIALTFVALLGPADADDLRPSREASASATGLGSS